MGKIKNDKFFLELEIKVPLTWPESHGSETEIDRLLVTRALVGECFDYNGGMRDHKAPISIFNEGKYHSESRKISFVYKKIRFLI